MSNEITSRYFTYTQKGDGEFLAKIRKRIDFIPEKEIFRGRIYVDNKVGSLIYKGMSKDKKAVLKIQILKPAIDEVDIIHKFNQQNKSKQIKVPDLYAGAKWNEADGFGYLLLEYIEGRPIYRPPLASDKEIKKFCRFYQEYKKRAVTKPFFLPDRSEKNALFLTTKRVKKWAQIAQAQGHLTKSIRNYLKKYFSLINYNLKDIGLQFMHGHLTYDDVYEVAPDNYVLMSNLFWSYRPEWYDSTFNIWMGVKSIRNLSITDKQIAVYTEKWLAEYKKLSSVLRDKNFEKKFWLMILERCIGALLVDLQNQSYNRSKEQHIKHLTNIFQKLFDFSAARL